jgi:phage-related protein
MAIKPLVWVGNSLNCIRDFPLEARRKAGHQLNRVQHGHDPEDWKPMPTVGLSVREIRIHEHGEYRVLYLAKFADAIYVLHAFSKKTRKTAKSDLDLASGRFRAVIEERRKQQK